MSLIIMGIDLPKMGETKRIVLYDNGDIVVNEEGWDEDGCRCYKTSYDVKAIQIPKGHGAIVDMKTFKVGVVDVSTSKVSWTVNQILEAERRDDEHTDQGH